MVSRYTALYVFKFIFVAIEHLTDSDIGKVILARHLENVFIDGMSVISSCKSSILTKGPKLYDPRNLLFTENFEPRFGYHITTNVSGIYTCISGNNNYTANFTFLPLSKYIRI